MKNTGDINRNGQQLLRITGEPGTDYNSRIWILKCRRCATIYGCNSTDGWQRKCPQCGQGAAGLPIPIERDGEDWTRDEHIIAFNLYCAIPFGRIHERNPDVIELAALLGRKVGSASRKLANFSRLDPVHQARDVKGLEHGSKGEELVWNEFADQPEELAFESARLLADRLGCKIEQVAEVDEAELSLPGVEREAIVRLRVNQWFFRRRVLSAYNYRCCVTGLSMPGLLVASHVIPWCEDAANRLNARNGLCLNALHDRAFDRGLMWVEEGFVVRISPKLLFVRAGEPEEARWLCGFDGKPLQLPNAFTPDPELLRRHADAARKRN